MLVAGNPAAAPKYQTPPFSIRYIVIEVIRLPPSEGSTADWRVPGEYGFMNKLAPNQSGTNISYTFYDFGIDP